MFESSDEDFDFDLDEVVKLNSQPFIHASTQNVSKGVISLSNENKEENFGTYKFSQGHSQGVSQERECNDESQFLETPDKPSGDSLHSQNSVKVFSENCLNQSSRGNHVSNNSPDSYESKSKQNNQPAFQKTAEKAKFPGPAGLLACSSQSNQLKGQRTKVNQKLTNMDGLCWWDKALSLLNVKSTWGTQKMNLKMIRKTFSPDVVYLTAPLLVVGVQKMESMPIIANDVDCFFQDPTGEAKGRILKDVFMDYSIQVGTILVLRRPNVLLIGTNCLVTVTKTCLIGMLPSHTNEIIKCHEFRREDLISWLAEPVVYGDPVLRNEEIAEMESTGPPAKLFTSAGPAQVAQSSSYSGTLPGIQSPANNYRPHPLPTTPSNYNRPRAPVNPTPRPSIRPLNSAGPSRTPNGPARPPGNSNQFQFKSPSAVVSTPRPAPYIHNQTSKSVPKPTNVAKEPEVVDDNYLSQFLDGIDTDSLFDDF